MPISTLQCKENMLGWCRPPKHPKLGSAYTTPPHGGSRFAYLGVDTESSSVDERPKAVISLKLDAESSPVEERPKALTSPTPALVVEHGIPSAQTEYDALHRHSIEMALMLMLSPNFTPYVGRTAMEHACNLVWRVYHQTKWNTSAQRYIRRVCVHNSSYNERLVGNEAVLYDPIKLATHVGVACVMLAIKSMPEGKFRTDFIINRRRRETMAWGYQEDCLVALMEWVVFETLGFDAGVSTLLHGYCEQSNLFADQASGPSHDYLHSLVVASYFGRLTDVDGNMNLYMAQDRRYVLTACLYLVAHQESCNLGAKRKRATISDNILQEQKVDVRVLTRTMKAAIALGIDQHVCTDDGLDAIFQLSRVIQQQWVELGGTNIIRTRGGVHMGVDLHQHWQ